MAQNAKNIYIPAPPEGGAVWSAPLGTTVPTDATSPLPEAFKSLGFISEDGIVNSEEAETTEIKAYGGTVVREVQTSRKETFAFTPMELNAQVLAEQYGDDNVTVGAGGTVTVVHNAKERPARIYVVESLLEGSTKVARDVLPEARVTNVGERKLATGEVIQRQVTVSCSPDASGNTAYTYYAGIVQTDIAQAGE